MSKESLRELLSKLKGFELALLCEEHLSKDERLGLYPADGQQSASFWLQPKRYGVYSVFEMPAYLRLKGLKSQNKFCLVDALVRVCSEELRVTAQKYIDGREAEDRYLKRLGSSTVVTQIVYVDKACTMRKCLRKLYGRIKVLLGREG